MNFIYINYIFMCYRKINKIYQLAHYYLYHHKYNKIWWIKNVKFKSTDTKTK